MVGKLKSTRERRADERRTFPHFLQFNDNVTGRLVGDLTEISRNGFRLEGMDPTPVNSDLQFRVDMPLESNGPPQIVFVAQSRWLRPDPFDPRAYLTGFEIRQMDQTDRHAFLQILERSNRAGPAASTPPDYLWKD